MKRKINVTIAEVITPQTIDLYLPVHLNKEGLLQYLASLIYNIGHISSQEEFLQAVYERESLGPTYMENFIAIPHGKSSSVLKATIAFGRSQQGIYYETAMGSGLAKLIFLLAIPQQMEADEYIAVLAHLARLLIHEEFCQQLYQAQNYQDVYQAIAEGERWLETEE